MARASAFVSLLLVSCLPGSGPGLNPYKDDAGTPPPLTLTSDAATDADHADVDLGDPFAIIGLSPSHGPFTGGTRATLRGRGFPSDVEVSLGGVRLDASDVLASTPTRAAITTPPGGPGFADVEVYDPRSGKRRSLTQAFYFDPYYVTPNTGATSGGTRVRITGKGTHFARTTTVFIDGKPCTELFATHAEEMECLTPEGSPGTKDVSVTTEGDPPSIVREGFTYADSPDGFRGGLSGAALSTTLRVIALDAWTGIPLPGAFAIVGETEVARTGASGVANLPVSAPKVAVTVAAKCHQPITFVDVPVDTVTAYLTPVMDPACADGDPPSTGGAGGRSSSGIEGELIWPGAVEFERQSWVTVPNPLRPSEREAAYVFVASGSPTAPFFLPAADRAVTPASSGVRGYKYSIDSPQGNLALYALAGIEDRAEIPPRFTAYSMGSLRGVSVTPGTLVTGADILMDATLDQGLTLSVTPPSSTPRGPDRIDARVTVSLATGAYASFPMNQRVTLFPIGNAISFLGIPSLRRSLRNASYVVSASAVTGVSGDLPASYVSKVELTDTSFPLSLGGFLSVPMLLEPGSNRWSGRHLAFQGSASADLHVIDVRSAGGLVTWVVVLPGTTTSTPLPDLSALPDRVGLRPGPLSLTIRSAKMGSFDYAKLRYGQLGAGAWDVYSADARSSLY